MDWKIVGFKMKQCTGKLWALEKATGWQIVGLKRIYRVENRGF
jgi:hypothetical protein